MKKKKKIEAFQPHIMESGECLSSSNFVIMKIFYDYIEKQKWMI